MNSFESRFQQAEKATITGNGKGSYTANTDYVVMKSVATKAEKLGWAKIKKEVAKTE